MKQKIKVLFKGPCLTQSGYGVQSRQLFDALFENELFDVAVESINWGNCPFLTEDTQQKRNILQCIQKKTVLQQNNQENYDLFIHCTIPNEFERKGKFNIGVTAGIECDRVSHVWVNKCNEMDLVIVPSEHARKNLLDTIVDWQNPQTGQKGSIKVNKPVVICHEGVDTNIFKKLTKQEYDQIGLNLDFETDFNFLVVGQWGKGGFNEDRKNIANTVKYFIEEFRGRKDVGLVLKTNMSRNSITDYEMCLQRLQQIKANFKADEVPPIYLIHGNFTDKEMSALYNHPKIKSFISFTHGECWGLPLSEAAACELPIIATNWSGHLEFLPKGKFSAVDYDLQEIPDAAVWDDILIKGSRWAVVSEQDAKHRMRKMVSSYSKPQEWAKELSLKIKEEFDLQIVKEEFIDTVKMFLSQKVEHIDPLQHLKNFVDTPNNFNVLYTMPMSAGDVFISTAVIDGLTKQLPEDYKIYFATDPKYADILKNNKHVHKVIPWNQNMMNIEYLEEVFDLALTPNMATQYVFSNWVRRGHGRLLAEEFANHCQCELGDYFIDVDDLAPRNFKLNTGYEHVKSGDDLYVDKPVYNYITLHTSSGQGQWSARKYIDWQEIVNNLKSYIPDLKIVQVGDQEDIKLDNIDVDLRGKTNFHQLSGVIKHSLIHLGIDSFPAHLSAMFYVPLVALYGSSYSNSTRPWYKDKSKAKYILLEPDNRLTCDRACYKNECKVNKEMSCINSIDSYSVFQSCVNLLKQYE